MQLRDYISVLGRRKWLIVFAMIVVTGSAVLASALQTPIYQAQARLMLQQTPSVFGSSGAAAVIAATSVSTEIQVIESEPVRQAVAKKVGSAPPVSATAVGDTTVIQVAADSTSPARAAAITNAYVDSYIDFKRQQTLDSMGAIGQQLQQKVNDLQKEIDDLANQIEALPPCTPTNSAACDQRNSLQKDRDGKIALQTPFKQRLDQLQVDQSVGSGGGAQLVARATPPVSPIRPRPIRNALLGLGAGLIFGIALAFVFEQLDDSIKTKDDFERVIHDIPVLGIIPVANGPKRGEPYVVAMASPTSPAAEAYRTLRTSIQFAGVNRPLRTLQVTSPSASEGKTTTAANLAVTLARAGKRVTLVSCDLRRPRANLFFGMRNNVGFTSVLLGEASLRSATKQVPGEDRLSILGSGPLPPNPSELLSAPRAGEIFTELTTQADIVIVDCPPVLPVTDAALLSSKVDATLIVVTVGSTTRKQLSRTLEILRQVKAPIIGAVLNGVSTDNEYGPDYYYRYEEMPRNGNGKRDRKAEQVERTNYSPTT
jgi:non-specific protein-tyrosine kinase